MPSPLHSLFVALPALATLSLSAGEAASSTYVDDHGTLRWTQTQAEVAQFGVNYTAPFAYAFRAHQPWRTRIVPSDAPVLLFDAATDAKTVTADHRDVAYDLVPSDRPGTSAMAMIARDLDEGEHDYSWRYYFRDKIAGRTDRLDTARRLVIYGRSATSRPCKVQLSLVTSDGFAYGATVELPPGHGRCLSPS